MADLKRTGRLDRWMQMRYLTGMLVLLIVVAACGEEEPGLEETEEGALEIGRVSVQAVEERTVAPSQRILELSGIRGTLTLQADNRDTAAWTFTKTARARDSTAAQEVLNNLTVEERGTEQRYTFELEGGTPTQSQIDIEGTIPARTPLVVRRSSGIVNLQGLTAGLDVEQTHGTVRVTDSRGDVRVRIRNGDIELDLSDLNPETSIDVATENGNIRIALPETASANIDAETEAGRVFSRGLSYTDRQLRASTAGYHFEGQMHDGGASVVARTTHGSITLQARKSDGQPEADPDTLAVPEDAPYPLDPDTLIQEPEGGDRSQNARFEDREDDANSDEDTVYTDVDQEAAPVGGVGALTREASYPEEAAANNVEGRVYVEATVNADGSVRSVELIRGIGYGCDEEALRVVRNADFEPARRGGEAVPSRTTVWVQFSG